MYEIGFKNAFVAQQKYYSTSLNVYQVIRYILVYILMYTIFKFKS